jgi:phosphate transport system ATP-binding protein
MTAMTKEVSETVDAGAPVPRSSRSAPTSAPVVNPTAALTAATRIKIQDVNAFYGEKQALFGVNLEVPDNAITAFIGASGCGKSTLLRCLNRMNDTIPGARVEGEHPDGRHRHQRPGNVDPVQVRTRIGMVFQKPNPFPISIYENIAYGPRTHKLTSSKAELDDLVERSLRRAALWDEVKDRLGKPGLGLSGGQQQRLCHRPRARRLTRRDPDGRTLLGARSHRDRAYRGAAGRTAQAHLHRDRHALDGAGRPRFARSPPSSTWAS